LQRFSQKSRRPEISRLLKALESEHPVPQTKVANKARALELDEFLISFVHFYSRAKGHANMRITFVHAAAGRAAAEAGWVIKPGTVTDLIRDRVSAVVPPRPKRGTSTLGVSQPEKPPPDDEDCT
jgi:hypothetical protein